MDKLKQFYTSKSWRGLSYSLKISRGGKCERCGFMVVEKADWKKLIGHHKVELTEANISDPNVSLNPDNIEIVCIDCHNKEHRRFGHRKQVYIVWGSPLSGKSTFVNQMSGYGDLIIDIDNLWQAISGQDRYIKPNQLKANVFALRDNLYDQVRTRLGSWYDCYIIGGYPNKIERDDIARRLGAECIYIDSTKEDCIKRAEGRPAEWQGHITKWFEDYERAGA